MLIGPAETLLCLTVFLNTTLAYQQHKYNFGRSDMRNTATSRPLPSEDRIRHSSRYPKIGEVINRIDRFSKDLPSQSTPKSIFNQKFRHKSWYTYYKTTTSTTTTSKPDPFDELTYGDYEDDEDRSDYDEEYDDEDHNDYDDDDHQEYDDGDADTYHSEELFETVTDDMQAEEPTERSSKAMSSLSEYKWNHLGTQERVLEARQQHIERQQSPEQVKVNAFLEHYARVNNQTKCSKPLPKVIPVLQEHPNSSRSYTPSCTVLHRCAEDTGCCNKHTKCQYKSRELVQLYFYISNVGASLNKVEKLEFYNHTECECRSPDNDPEKKPEDPSPNVSYKSYNRWAGNKNNVKSCTCPQLFQDAKYSNRCICDCAEGNEDCLQLKKGLEHFRMSERICIQDKRCGMPICEHGVYQILLGKCPTIKEKLEEYSRINLDFGRT